MQTITAEKINALSQSQLVILLQESFFKLGKKMVLTKEEFELFINDIRRYQGRMSVADFEDAFALFAAGELNVDKLSISVSPLFVGRLMKAYKAVVSHKSSVVSSGGVHPCPASASMSDEHAWNNYLRHIFTYYSIPENPNWISLFNHCVYKGWITDVPPIEGWCYKAYKRARQDVRRFTEANWGDIISNRVESEGEKRQGIGTRLKNSLGL